MSPSRLKQVSRTCLLVAATFAALLPATSQAIVGVQSGGGGTIGQAHIDFAANLDLGRTVGFVYYGDGTATGTLVPSAVAGQLKFLTAAHNVDSNNDGVLDAGAGNITIYFGNAPGLNGVAATYSVTATATQIAVNPLWASSGGSAANDMAVVTFTFAQITPVTGGASTLQFSAVSSTSSQGLEGRVAGHGLHSDGTLNLNGENPEDAGNNPPGNAQADVNGILKGGTNIIDFIGVPGNIAPPTVAPGSGNVILLDFDKPDGTTSTFGGATGGALEAGTAKGDSGSALFADTNGDGKYEVVGVLNGGDNPFPGGASAFGDVSQFAAVLTTTNLQFLVQQGVFVGTAANGVSAGDFGGAGFAVVDQAGINSFNAGVQSAQQAQSFATQSVTPQLSGIQTHVNRIQRGTSRLENVGGDEVTLRDAAGFGSRRWEAWAAGNLGRVDVDTSTTNGLDSRFSAATVGLDFLANSNLIVGASWSYLDGRGHSTFSDLDMESNGNAVGFHIAGNWGGLNSSLIYSYAHSDMDLTRSVGGALATASPDVSAHTIDWTLSYNFRKDRWVHGPTGGLRYTHGNIDSYAESASLPVPGLASVSAQDFDAFRANVGYNVSYHIPITNGKIVPFFSAAYIYQRLHTDSATATYQGTPFFVVGGGGLVPFGAGPTSGVSGSSRSDSFANLQAGVELITNGGFTLTVQGFLNVFRQDLVEGGGGVQMGLAF